MYLSGFISPIYLPFEALAGIEDSTPKYKLHLISLSGTSILDQCDDSPILLSSPLLPKTCHITPHILGGIPLALYQNPANARFVIDTTAARSNQMCE